MALNLDAAILTWLREYANQGILITDSQLHIADLNRWLEIHSGRRADDLLGQHLFEVYPDLATRRLDRFYERALAGEVAVLAQRFHGYLLPMAPTVNYPGLVLMQQTARIAPLIGEAGIAGTITVVEDVTERFVYEEALRQARDELELRVKERTAELAIATGQLQSLSRRLLEVQENERRAVARELHDESGQALTSLMLNLALLEQEQTCSPDLVERVAELKKMTGAIMEGIHRLAVNLRPVSLDRVGLVPALMQYVESFRRQTSLDIELVTVGLDERLAADVETALYRLVQEALTNVARHAHASAIGIILERRDQIIVAIVEDNGQGFDLANVSLDGRLGLLGMRERVEMLGGKLTIESSPGSGTTLFAEVPARLLQTPA